MAIGWPEVKCEYRRNNNIVLARMPIEARRHYNTLRESTAPADVRGGGVIPVSE